MEQNNESKEEIATLKNEIKGLKETIAVIRQGFDERLKRIENNGLNQSVRALERDFDSQNLKIKRIERRQNEFSSL
jgi:hypothetical protein